MRQVVGNLQLAVDSGPELEKAKSLLRVRKEQVLRCYQILKLKAVMNGGSEDDKRALQKEFKEGYLTLSCRLEPDRGQGRAGEGAPSTL